MTRKLLFLIVAAIMVTVPVLVSGDGDIKDPKFAIHVGPVDTLLPVAVDLEKSKEVFGDLCSKCHSLKRPLGKTKDQAGWKKTVDRMNKNSKKRFGKGISTPNQRMIVNYLAAKNTFEATCSKCHALSRPLGKTKNRAAWERTVKRMSKNHKAKFGKILPDDVQANIVGYLVESAGK